MLGKMRVISSLSVGGNAVAADTEGVTPSSSYVAPLG